MSSVTAQLAANRRRLRAHGGIRVRSIADLRHTPSGHGKGKWHSMRTFWAWRIARKKARKVSQASRARNRQ